MLLVIDVGNTHTVLGLFQADQLCGQWRIVTKNYRTADELRIILAALLQQAGIDPASITGCCISSVVPPLNTALASVCRDTFGVEPLFVGPGIRTGLVIQVENPKEVGADRIVNAVGAIDAYGPQPLIIVDFGTATTFDVISERAEYRGGVIVPGIQISADALFERCAKLPRVEITRPPRVIGRDTISHMRSGLTYGYADLVDGLIRRIELEMEASPMVIATGGLAPLIADISERIEKVDQELTLNGLRVVFQKNVNESS